MSFPHWTLQPETIFKQSVFIPVIVVNNLDDVVPMANAIMAGGINVLEVTLRTPLALEAIRLLCQQVPKAIIGAGTVTTPEQLQQCITAGAKFAISPGFTAELLQAGKAACIPLIPGIASISELMQGIAMGYSHFKFFPAEAAGGVKALKSIYGPFADIRFCPTGGINPDNVQDYLALPNVDCVGGSWIIPDDALQSKDWLRITALSLTASQLNNN